MKLVLHSFFIMACLLAASGCYRMPSDDDFCTIPTTNNPDVTRDKGSSMLPNVGY